MAKTPEGYERWVSLYPAYINKDKTLAEGRRIRKEKAVSSPSCKEMLDVLLPTGLQTRGERKIYSREKSKEPHHWGRVRVQIKSPIGDLINNQFKTRDDLMYYIAEKIPTLKTRTNPKPSPEVQSQQATKQGKGKKKKQ